MESPLSILFAVLFGAAYVAVASMGINVFNKCSAIQDSRKWKNMHLILSNTMVVAMTIPVVLVVQMMASGRVTAAVLMLYGLMGVIGSSVAYGLVKEKQCESISKPSDRNFLMIAIVLSFVIMFGGGMLLGSSRGD